MAKGVMKPGKPRSAVVTGAGRGIGRAMAIELLGRGYQVVVTDLDEDAAKATAAEIGAPLAFGLDVRDVHATRGVVEEARRLAPLGAFVCNAGVAFDDTLHYIKQRKQFGRPIGSFQVLRHRIADLATEIGCCKLLVHRTAELVDRDPAKVLPRESSMVKLKTTEVAREVALAGMQMMGGYGYAREFDMEGHVRRTIVSTIYGGTNEIQRDIIGKTYGL